MKKLSIWAGHHVFVARSLLVVFHVYLFISALMINAWLAANHICIVSHWFIVPIVVGIFSLIALTIFKERLLVYTTRFVVGKTRIAIMAVCSFIFIMGLLHTDSYKKMSLYNDVQGSFTESLAKKTRPQYEDYIEKKDFYKDLDTYYRSLSKKELKKELKLELSDARKESNGLKVLYILLILIGAFIALFGVAALACSIACSGSSGLAIFIAFLGAFGIVFLAVYLIKTVLKKKRATPPKEMMTN